MKKSIARHSNKIIFGFFAILISLIAVVASFGGSRFVREVFSKDSNTAIAAGPAKGLNSDNAKIVPPVLDTEKPSVPTNLHWVGRASNSLECGNTISDLEAGSVKAYWDSSTDNIGVDHYEYVSFNAPKGSVWPSLELGHIVTHSIYSNGGFTPLVGTYGFMVRAVDAAGNKSDWTNVNQDIEGSCQITFALAT